MKTQNEETIREARAKTFEVLKSIGAEKLAYDQKDENATEYWRALYLDYRLIFAINEEGMKVTILKNSPADFRHTEKAIELYMGKWFTWNQLAEDLTFYAKKLGEPDRFRDGLLGRIRHIWEDLHREIFKMIIDNKQINEQ